MNVILISGKAQHGKDTTAQFLKDALEASGQKVLITHYGDLLKYICTSFFGWNGQKDEAGRSLLQHVGTEVIRKRDRNFWAWFVCQMLTFFKDEWDFVIIPDCRFPNELTYLMMDEDFDVTHIRMTRPDFDNGLTDEQKAHPSETALDDVKPDFVFCNNGTLPELRRIAEDWVAHCVPWTGTKWFIARVDKEATNE